jgi:hypothetical protein
LQTGTALQIVRGKDCETCDPPGKRVVREGDEKA